MSTTKKEQKTTTKNKPKKTTVKGTKKTTSNKKTTTKKIANKNTISKKSEIDKKEKIGKTIIDFIKEHKKHIIGITLLLLAFLTLYSSTHYRPFEKIKKSIDKKESFVIIIDNGSHMTDSYKRMLEYYQDAYDFKYTFININNWPSETYDKLINMLKIDKNTLAYPYLLYIEKGKTFSSSNNVTDENAFKNFLINIGIIKEEYEVKDYLLNDDEFKGFINNKNGNILLYAWNDENVHKYRQELLKAKAKYSIIYAERINNQETETALRKMLKLSNDEDPKLPMLIKFKSGKIVDYTDDINLSNVITQYKKLEKK